MQQAEYFFAPILLGLFVLWGRHKKYSLPSGEVLLWGVLLGAALVYQFFPERLSTWDEVGPLRLLLGSACASLGLYVSRGRLFEQLLGSVSRSQLIAGVFVLAIFTVLGQWLREILPWAN